MARLSAEDWIDEGLRLLVDQGVTGVRISTLATRLGVTKGSFYWHFSDHDALLQALVARWEDRATDEIIRHVDATDDDPRARLATLVAVTVRARGHSAALEGAVRAWGQSNPAVAAVLQRVDDRRVNYATGLLVDAGLGADVARSRARLLYRVMVGEFTFVAMGRDPLSDDAVAELLAMVTAGG